MHTEMSDFFWSMAYGVFQSDAHQPSNYAVYLSCMHGWTGGPPTCAQTGNPLCSTIKCRIEENFLNTERRLNDKQVGLHMVVDIVVQQPKTISVVMLHRICLFNFPFSIFIAN